MKRQAHALQQLRQKRTRRACGQQQLPSNVAWKQLGVTWHVVRLQQRRRSRAVLKRMQRFWLSASAAWPLKPLCSSSANARAKLRQASSCLLFWKLIVEDASLCDLRCAFT